jgi:hypothetical protein
MTKLSRFAVVTFVALLVPGMLLVVSGDRTDFASSVWEGVSLILTNWAFLVSPQLFVLALAIFFPTLRRGYCVVALISLTVLLVFFEGLIFWFSDPNGPLLFGFYFPSSLVVLFVVAITSHRRLEMRNVKPEL